MSIVAVHGPTMWGGSGAAGGGSGPTVDNAGGTVTANMTNGLQFSLLGKGDRPAVNYDWTFSDGTAAINDAKGPVNVTFTTPGTKTITLTVGNAGGTTPPATTYTFVVVADTQPGAQIVDNIAATVTSDPANGLLFNLSGKGDRAAADYDWTFSDGTAAINNTKSTSVTFTTAGSKTITLTLGTSGGTTPPGGVYTYVVTATTGAQPRGLMESGAPPEAPEAPAAFDPFDYTIAEVMTYVTENPDQTAEVLAAELAGKDRVTLVAQLEELLPYEPADHTIPDVVAYATAYPDEVADIIAKEEAGKNRTTLLSQLAAL